jgi:photosystem II stability/assembly factor-like uncharacterized protein
VSANINRSYRKVCLEHVGDLAFGLQTPIFCLYFVPKILIILWHNSGFQVSSKQKIVSFRLKAQFPNILLFFFCLLFFFSCKKETIEVIWEELASGTSDNLSAVHFTDENSGHIIGGKTWYNGIYLQTKDGGATWAVDNFADKQLFGLYFNANNIGYTVGIDGYLFSSSDDSHEQWIRQSIPRPDILRDVCFNNRNEGVLVGGVAFAQGVIMVVDTNYATLHVDTFLNQLNAVCYSDDNTIHVAGYGIIFRSVDGGTTWIENEVSGDFFQSISFPSPTTGYIVGYNGTILKTTDKGITWKNLRRGDAIGIPDKPFTAVHFADELYGYIVGEKGLCWRTIDGGEHWQIVKGLPGFDFSDVYMINDKVYIVGESGGILRFRD